MADCTQCADYEWCAKNEECGMFKPKPITNYDLIRSKSVEEMAVEMTAKGGCPHDCDTPDDMDTDCVQCCLDWLKQEVATDG